MSSSSLSPQTRNRLETLIALARLLERAERNELRPSADEYQRLVEQTKQALQAELPEPARHAVLDAFPRGERALREPALRAGRLVAGGAGAVGAVGDGGEPAAAPVAAAAGRLIRTLQEPTAGARESSR